MVNLSRFSYLNVEFVVLQLRVEQKHDWTWQHASYSLVLEQADEILNDGHALLIQVRARNVCSHNILLLIYCLVELNHFLDILSIENEFWAGSTVPFILTL